MDLFIALADTLNTDCPHLPLKEGMMTADVFQLVNLMYLEGNPQDPNCYGENQAYYNREGRLQFDVIDKVTGKVLMTFINKSMAVTPQENSELVDNTELMSAPLVLKPTEAWLVKDLLQGMKYPVDRPSHDDFPYNLAQLFNERGYLGSWSSGTYGTMCTGGVEVVYKGPGKNTPDGYPKPNSALVAILQINYGERKGRVCLVT